MIDRITPTQRPTDRVVQLQKWEKLLFLHWRIPVDELRQLVPEELSIDLFDGDAYIGIVPFIMSDVCPTWWPTRLAFNFLETNVRTYVHHNGIPGVYFLSLDANSRLAVWIARLIWGLPYHFADMSFQQDGDQVAYQTKRRSKSKAHHQVDYRIGSELGTASEGTLEFFLLERYVMFASGRQGIQIGYVHHSPYVAHEVEQLRLDDSLLKVAGFDVVQEEPFCAHYVESVQAEIFQLKQA